MSKLRMALVSVGFRLPLYPLVTPPLGIMYLAAHLRSKFEAEFLLINQKLNNLANDALLRQVLSFAPDVVGFSAITPTAKHLPYLVGGLKEALPDLLVVLGGPYVSAFGPGVLGRTHADVAITGEGEIAFEQVVEAYRNGSGFEAIPGLTWRDKQGEEVTNPGRIPLIEELDSLPLPAYDLIDMPKYWRRQGIAPIPKRKYISLFSSRGCPYRCYYCHDVFGKSFRRHSAERIADEAAYYKKRYEIDEIEFLDDIFNLDHKRLMEFCRLVRERELGLKIAFPTAIRTDILRDEEIDALVDAGMYYCGFSLESGSPRLQKLMGKNLNVDKFVENVNKVAAKRVYSNGFAMLGFPTETEEEMYRTIDVACSTNLHTISFFTVTPFPGTGLYRVVMDSCPERMRGVTYDDMDFSSFNVNLSTVPDKRFYEIQREANRRFFMDLRRALRTLRDYPKPYMLPMYAPHLLKRATKGLFFNLGVGSDRGADTIASRNRDVP